MRKLKVLHTIAALCLSMGVGATVIACSTGEEEAPAIDEGSHSIEVDWLAEIINAKSSQELLTVLDAYDAAVPDAQKQVLSDKAQDILLGAPYVRIKRAELLHELGRYAEADQLYTEVLAMPDSPFPKSFVAFKRVLAQHGGDQFSVLTKADGALVEELKQLEAGFAADEYGADLNYNIAMASWFAGAPDVDRLKKAADLVEIGAPRDNAITDATTLSVTIQSLVVADRRAEAEALYEKLLAFDQIHNTGLSKSGIGAAALGR